MDDKIRIPTDLGTALQQRRKAARLSATAVARRAGKARDVVYRLERGDEASVSSLMGLRVRDVLSDQKYQGSYERMAQLLQYLRLPAESRHRFFAQMAFSVMVRNGDGHLKNFGVLYTCADDVRLAPMFDVVTTATCATGAGPSSKTAPWPSNCSAASITPRPIRHGISCCTSAARYAGWLTLRSSWAASRKACKTPWPQQLTMSASRPLCLAS